MPSPARAWVLATLSPARSDAARGPSAHGAHAVVMHATTSNARAGLLPLATCLLLPLNLAQVLVQTIEAQFPEAAVALNPVRHVLERARFQAAGSPLGPPPACNQARVLEHLEVLGDCRKAQVEGLGERGDRLLTGSEARQDGAPGGIGEGRERGAELVCRHGYFTKWLIS